MTKYIYLDNAATSFPKPSAVIDSITEYMSQIGANINRSTHLTARMANMKIFETRELAKQLFHFPEDESQVIFTAGATFSLNQVIKGYLKPNDHVLISSLEHNAVMRPLKELEKHGLKISFIPTDNNGIADINKTKYILSYILF